MFLHGYLADKNSFVYQKDFFERDFEVHAIDLKGFGQNKDMPYPYSLTDYANEVKDYIEKNGLKTPHVIAHSFGARIAIKLSSENPFLFDKLVLTGAAGLKPRRTVKYYFKRGAYKLLKPVVKKEKLKNFFSSDYNALSPVMKQSFNLIVNEHLDGKLKDVENQTLLVFGAFDKETPLYMAKRLNQGIRNSRLIVVDGAGHFAFIDKPYKFNLEVREFLLS